MSKYSRYVLIAVALYMGVRILLSYQLVKTADRHGPAYALTPQQMSKIKTETEGMTATDIITYSTKLTAEMLEFSRRNDLKAGKANCIGYANLCSAVCRYAFKINHIEGRITPVVGYVSKLRINLCSVLAYVVPSSYKGFVKNHDFVEIDMGHYYIYFDPCLYDFTLDNGLTYEIKERH